MINISTVMLYIAGVMVLIISPGPDFIYVTTRGISQGRKAGVLSAIGISIGLFVHTALGALGLSAILSTSNIAFQTVKYTGAAYLIYIGVKALLTRNTFLLSADDNRLSNSSIVRQGMLTNVFNPKVILTFMAYMPQFINPSDKTASFQIIILGAIQAVLATVWFSFIGFFAGIFGQWLSKRLLFQKAAQYFTGSVLILLGLRLVFIRRD